MNDSIAISSPLYLAIIIPKAYNLSIIVKSLQVKNMLKILPDYINVIDSNELMNLLEN